MGGPRGGAQPQIPDLRAHQYEPGLRPGSCQRSYLASASAASSCEASSSHSEHKRR